MKLRAASAPQPKVFAAGEMVLFLGAKYRLRFESVPAIELRGEEIWLPIRFESAAQEKLEAWYRAEARRILPKRIGHFARQMEVQPRGLRISSARTRWGSCSARDSLNFSWRLVLAPLPVLDYVVVHELAHIPHKNHGQRFWHKVAKTMPDFESHKKWLRQHGAELMRY